MKKALSIFLLGLLALSLCFGSGTKEESQETNLTFFFPVQVAGPLAVEMTAIVEEFNNSQDLISVEAVYSGNYDQTVQKAITSANGGNPPAVVVATSISLFEFLDFDLIEDLNQFMEGEDTGYDQNFFKGFMKNSMVDGKTWSLPFQRSVPIFYYNKKMFVEVGLDPENPPKTWDEVRTAANKLVQKDGSGNITRWGYEDITDDTWLIQGLILQAGGQYANEEGTKAYFDTPAIRDVFDYWLGMSRDDKVMPSHRFYGAASQDFVAETTAMITNSSGSMSFVSKSAEFDFGVTALPGNVKNGFPTGGGNLYIFKDLPENEKQAAWTFVKWMTRPEIAARWSMATGYIAAREDAFETESMKEYMKANPYVAIVKDQLQYADREMAFHSNSQIRETLKVAIADILDGEVSVDEGLKQLQIKVDEILAPFVK